MWYKNIAGRFFGLVTKHACDRQTDRQTDGRTDGQNYDSQDRASIAASRGKKATSPPHMVVQSYSPGGHNVHLHLVRASLEPPESTSQTEFRSVQRFLQG